MNDKITLTKEQYEELNSHSQMLGQIGAYVDDFIKDDEDTVLEAVIRLLSKYHECKADFYYHRLEEQDK